MIINDTVYCVYAYPDVEGAMYPCVERIFGLEDDADEYMKKENERAGWRRVTCIDRMEVE